MLNLRHMNPMVRAIGTMGAVSALVGGITFAQLTSNTVALSPNTLSTGSANLEIGGSGGSGNNNNNGNNGNNGNNNTIGNDVTNNNNNGNNGNNGNGNTSCRNSTNGTIPGFNLTGTNGLIPSVVSSPLDFCLKNTSSVPLDLTVNIPQTAFTGDTGIPADEVTLAITCDNGGVTSGTLDEYTGTTSLGTLDANTTTDCQATVELSDSYTVTGTQSVPSFDIQFVGTTAS